MCGYLLEAANYDLDCIDVVGAAARTQTGGEPCAAFDVKVGARH